MALDISLHLLGGDPHAFQRQPREAQVDLLAYWRLRNDRSSTMRWASMGPARLADIGTYAGASGLGDVLAGMRAWLGAQGVRWTDAPRSAPDPQHLANARRCGASRAAVGYWLGAG